MPTKKPTLKTFTTTIIEDDETSGTGFELPFDPKEVFGRTRVPVTVTINDYTYRSTIFSMSGCFFLPLAKVHRDAAKVKAGAKVKVTLAEDTAPRTIAPPRDLAKLLKSDDTLKTAWEKLSYSHQKEHVMALEEAKKPETRARRLEKLLEALRSPKARPRA